VSALGERACIEENVVGGDFNIAARQKLARECLAYLAVADQGKAH
jgi:hypothetical protein